MTWPIEKLGDIAKIYAGSSAPQDEKYFKDGKYPFFRVSDLNGQRNKNLTNSRDYVNDLSVRNLRLTKAEKNSIVLPKSGAAILTNSRAILGVGGYVVSHLAVVKSDESRVLSSWLYLFLCNFDMANLVSDFAYPSLKLSDVANIQIPFPPLPEQKRIVEKIQRVFAKIEEAERLRAQTLSASAAILPSALHQIFNSQIKSRKSKLTEVAELIMGQSPPSTAYNRESDGLPFYQGKKDFGEDFPLPSVWCNEPSKVAEENDILISVRAPVGPVNICREKSAIGRGLAALRVNENILGYKFLYYFLKHLEDQWAGRGSTFSSISKNDFETKEIPILPISEQERIAAELDAVAEKTRRLQELQRQTQQDFAALKQSILHQAFQAKNNLC